MYYSDKQIDRSEFLGTCLETKDAFYEVREGCKYEGTSPRIMTRNLEKAIKRANALLADCYDGDIVTVTVWADDGEDLVRVVGKHHVRQGSKTYGEDFDLE